MRAIALGAAAAAMIMVAGCGKKEGGDAAASGVKSPKAGVWEMTITAAGMAAPATKVCMGETPAGTNPFMPPPAPGETCSKNSVTATASGYAIDMACTAGGQSMTTTGTVSGDLESSYKVDMKTKVGTMPEMAMVIDAKRIGDCPAGTAQGAVVP